MPSAGDELEGRLYAAIMKNPKSRNIPIDSLTKGLVGITKAEHRNVAAGVVQDLKRRGITARVVAKRTVFAVTISN